ncbi:MAG: adenosylcobinamide-GDP ribazoletransferase [Pseudomonadota bacterium]|nr:adenosylcobinamide-GDP ribazoletransferase [Pseudomonadota bacterium]
MNTLRQQLNLWWIAVAFFTRIPVPSSVEFSQANLNRASRYFSAVGWLIGLICGAVLWAFMLIFPQDVAVLLAMIVSLLLTGCFHEDGLADTCDGLGGGWTTEQKLRIMKDSRVGTYGAAALWVSLTLKFVLLSQLLEPVLALIIAHPLSRIIPTLFIAVMPYVSDSDTSKAKPLAESGSWVDTAIAVGIGSCALLLVPVGSSGVGMLLAVLLVVGVMSFLFLKKQLGGFTGDALGAVQQVSELALYLAMILIIGSVG